MADDVLQLEERRWNALIENKFDELDALTHPELVYTHSNAMVDSKESWLASVTSGFVDYRAVDREDIAVIYSGTAAVITGKAAFTVGVQDHEIAITARFTSVWVTENDTWQFFAWQNTPLPQ